MSRQFIDTAVLETYRRSELEDRVSKFANVCDVTIAYLNNLKAITRKLVNQLSCDCNPDHLRDSFLSCMSQVEEYNYIVSEFQLSIAKFGQLNTAETDPQQDTKAILKPMMAEDVHLMDLLSEPSTSTQKVSDNYSPKPLTKAEKIKLEDSFIIFSSSNSIASTAESLCQTSEPRVVTVDKSNVQVYNSDRQLDKSDGQIEHQVVASSGPVDSGIQNVDSNGEMAVSPVINSHSEDVASQKESNPSNEYESVEDSNGQGLPNVSDVEAECQLSELTTQLNGLHLFFRGFYRNLPTQKLLTVDTSYNALIIHIEDLHFYVITEDFHEVEKFWYDMTEFYKINDIRNATPNELREFRCCAVLEPDIGFFYRAISFESDGDKFYVYLVDTGVKMWCSLDRIFLLMPEFYSRPPYAYFCQLSRVDLTWHPDKELIQRCCKTINKYLGMMCVIKVDDNFSDIYDVTVFLGNNITLNQLILSEALSQNAVEPQAEAEESDLETEDALVAATGYNNRDEAANCEYATRGQHCPRGERCKLKHDVLFTDGWTLDRVEVVARLPEMPMPPVGAKVRVHVIEVCHFDRVYVHFLDNQPEEVEPPKFGESFYPTTLSALVRDMNIPAERSNHKPLELEPAPGEIVAALYPPDGTVYRARVISVSRIDQTIQVKYLDYGNMMWVRSANVYQLSPLHCALPAQAVLARLAHVTPLKYDSRYLADLRPRLSQLVLNKHCVMTIVGHENDELVVKLEDENGLNVALQMARLGLVLYSEKQSSEPTETRKPSSRKQTPIIVPG